MDHRDPRAVLGLPLHATRDEAQRAFRRLAKQTHPDAGGRAADFRAVAAAWAELRPQLPVEQLPVEQLPVEPRRPVVAPHLAAYRPAPSRVVWAEPRRPVRRDFATVLQAEMSRRAA